MFTNFPPNKNKSSIAWICRRPLGSPNVELFSISHCYIPWLWTLNYWPLLSINSELRFHWKNIAIIEIASNSVMLLMQYTELKLHLKKRNICIQYSFCTVICSRNWLVWEMSDDALEVRVMVFNAAFHNISALLVEETEVSGENNRPAANHWKTLSHNVVSSTPCHERDSNSQR